MSRDFSSPVFFIKQLLLVSIGMSRNDFKLFANIRGVIYIGNDSTVMNTLGSLLESFWIRQFFTHKSHVPKKLNNYSQF
jgi:hypothetical protein